MNSKKLFNRKFTLPSWLYLVGIALFYEGAIHLWISDPVDFGRLAAVVGFALGFGAVLGLLTSFLKPKAAKWVSVGISFAMAVVYLTEYFLSDAYQNFMPFITIFAGAGGVFQDYFNVVVSLLIRDFWRIALFLLPLVVYSLWGVCPESGKKQRLALLCAGVVCYGLGFGAVTGLTNDSKLFSDAYNFDSAVRYLGMNMGLTLDTVNAVLPQKEPEFEIAVPPVATEPAETQQTHQTKPAGDAEETVPQEETKEYGVNALNVDFAAAVQDKSQAAVASIHNYVASMQPSQKNEYTGMFAGKNLILITAEAFAAEVIDPELTPTLYRMATKGIHFKDYYQPAWGASTISGEFSNVVGLVPANGGSCMMEARQQKLFLTMGHQLQKQGYYSTAYHNHIASFYDRHMTHVYLGYDRYIARFAGLEITGVWPESDLEMIDNTVPEYIDHQPFSIYYMTVSGHCPYGYQDNAMSHKNWDKVDHLDYSDTVKGYLAANLELEYAMESLLRQLEEAGIADDTVVVISADHHPYALERSATWNNTEDNLAELYGVKEYDTFVRDHNGLILWSGCLEDKNIVVEDPVYSLDILPTLSNLFGVEYDSRLLVGRDVFSEEEPLVLWPEYNWLTDKGSYYQGTFTPRDGVQVEDGYADRINAIVKNKITFSHSVANSNYYNYVLELMEQNPEQK